ncbi:MAG: hypothetical protein WEA76_02885 [Acidimicrobiia bacterium]
MSSAPSWKHRSPSEFDEEIPHEVTRRVLRALDRSMAAGAVQLEVDQDGGEAQGMSGVVSRGNDPQGPIEPTVGVVPQIGKEALRSDSDASAQRSIRRGVESSIERLSGDDLDLSSRAGLERGEVPAIYCAAPF